RPPSACRRSSRRTGAVREDQGHTVAFPDTEALEAGGEAAREIVELLVGEPRVDAASADSSPEYGCDRSGTLPGGALEKRVEWQFGVSQMAGDPRVVRRFPLAHRLHHAHNVETRLSASLASAMPRALILGGARTPFVKAGTAFAEP